MHCAGCWRCEGEHDRQNADPYRPFIWNGKLSAPWGERFTNKVVTGFPSQAPSSLSSLGPEGAESSLCSPNAISRPSLPQLLSKFLSNFPLAISLSLTTCCSHHPTSVLDDFNTWLTLFSSTSTSVFIFFFFDEFNSLMNNRSETGCIFNFPMCLLWISPVLYPL